MIAIIMMNIFLTFLLGILLRNDIFALEGWLKFEINLFDGFVKFIIFKVVFFFFF